jgi:hypothetical protein
MKTPPPATAESRKAPATQRRSLALDETSRAFEASVHNSLRNSLLQQLREARYKTNDMIEIIGGFRTPEKQLRINGIDPIHLNQAQLVVMLVLAAHALTMAGLPSPRRIRGRSFLSSQEILQEVDKWRAEEPALAALWINATSDTLHRTICALREKMSKAGGNGNLIESGQPGEGGYRLSTPASNIRFSLE